MIIPRLLLLVFLFLIAISWFPKTAFLKKSNPLQQKKITAISVVKNNTKAKLEQKSAEAKKFVHRKGFNENVCFLIDMTLPSGQNRFFIYDLKEDSLQGAGLVAHGNCFQEWLEGRKYSNVVGSGCTSLGKYKIGNSYTGKWGYSYKLHGLDSSNSNAFTRTVVLHSHSCVSETEGSDDICQSNGCPTIAPLFFEKLKTIINQSSKPVLMWIYE